MTEPYAFNDTVSVLAEASPTSEAATILKALNNMTKVFMMRFCKEFMEKTRRREVPMR